MNKEDYPLRLTSVLKQQCYISHGSAAAAVAARWQRGGSLAEAAAAAAWRRQRQLGSGSSAAAEAAVGDG